MQENVYIEFEPKCTYTDWVFNGVVDSKKNNLGFFSKNQLEDCICSVLDTIPKRILDAAILCGWKIIVTNTRNLERECGAPKEIYGYTNFETKEILVYATKEGIEISLPHELAHFVDVLTNISVTRDWKTVYEFEKDIYKSMSYSFTTPRYASECFADAFMLYVIDNKLLRNVPSTYNVINNLFTYIDYILDDNCINKYLEQQKLKHEESTINNFLTKSYDISCFAGTDWN